MERKTISAHELNKFAYCPYQWYYERLYGRKELRRRYQERNARLSRTDTQQSRFVRGEQFHRRSYQRWKRRQRIWKWMFLLFAAACIVGYLWVRYGGMA